MLRDLTALPFCFPTVSIDFISFIPYPDVVAGLTLSTSILSNINQTLLVDKGCAPFCPTNSNVILSGVFRKWEEFLQLSSQTGVVQPQGKNLSVVARNGSFADLIAFRKHGDRSHFHVLNVFIDLLGRSR